MTKSELDKIRDEMAQDWWSGGDIEPNKWHRPIAKGAYKEGWDDCTSLLWPIIERQREALESIADYSVSLPDVDCFHMIEIARQALELPATDMSSVSETATKRDEKGE